MHYIDVMFAHQSSQYATLQNLSDPMAEEACCA
jgi:hypothetical protein